MCMTSFEMIDQFDLFITNHPFMAIVLGIVFAVILAMILAKNDSDQKSKLF